MPGLTEDAPTAGGGLYDYDVDAEDLFQQLGEAAERSIANEKTTTTTTSIAKKQKGAADDLGIDEEIKVTKKRAPVAKLDENRLLSSAGIPKLRRITKERLKFKGKGHEYTDVGRLLNTYQLWLDDLYPKAKFADGLKMLEKLGHSRRMQVMRREWIDEGKPKVPRWEDEVVSATRDNAEQNDGDDGTQGQVAQESPAGENAALGTGKRSMRAELYSSNLFLTDDEDEDGDALMGPPPDDKLDALLAEDAGDAGEKSTRQVESAATTLSGTATLSGTSLGKSPVENGLDQPDVDELDALLAEDEATGQAQHQTSAANTGSRVNQTPMDDFAAEEEAMADMDGMW